MTFRPSQGQNITTCGRAKAGNDDMPASVLPEDLSCNRIYTRNLKFGLEGREFADPSGTVKSSLWIRSSWIPRLLIRLRCSAPRRSTHPSASRTFSPASPAEVHEKPVMILVKTMNTELNQSDFLPSLAGAGVQTFWIGRAFVEGRASSRSELLHCKTIAPQTDVVPE
ncbi:hypothetical protein B0H17DRAFT_1149343 [Mycena rosella]|uniref:Uncharacterized protein n=1 Tax=Mycena rosella TaxID=1033263 RepID=A0AAD7C3D1_MYCRO|nr:hypothetical protein B0H17DRAFT_1149343 [Mycena rosella]